MDNFSNIVLNIPHSSDDGVLSSGWGRDVMPFVDRWTDWHTDVIFGSGDRRILSVVFDHSRFVCDVERLIGDEKEKEGQGIIYEYFGEAKRDMSKIDRNWIMGMYYLHRNRLGKCLTDTSLLIDCHSFPSDISDVDICIGFNDDWSKPDCNILSLLHEHFSENGYSVSYNNPYSNSIAPETGFTYKSVMIDINKRTYMNGAKTDITKIRKTILNLYDKILNI